MSKPRQSLSRLFLNKPPADEVIHRKRLQALSDQHQGKPFILDDDGLRMMYLTPTCMQSAMKLDEPHRLICAYSRIMMGFLLFNPAPKHIILIGLGGGSLLKYCYHHLPDCRITAIEINADVIAMREQFFVPPDDERLTVIHADAAEWLPQQTEQADVIFLDAYDTEGLVPALNNAAFYAHCYRNLHACGVLIANVWGKPSTLSPMLEMLYTQFAHQLRWLKSYDSYNLIVFASKQQTGQDQLIANAEKLNGAHESLRLAKIPLHWHLITPSAPGSEDMIDAIKQSLRGILVTDPNVPQSYAEWKLSVQA